MVGACRAHEPADDPVNYSDIPGFGAYSLRRSRRGAGQSDGPIAAHPRRTGSAFSRECSPSRGAGKTSGPTQLSQTPTTRPPNFLNGRATCPYFRPTSAFRRAGDTTGVCAMRNFLGGGDWPISTASPHLPGQVVCSAEPNTDKDCDRLHQLWFVNRPIHHALETSAITTKKYPTGKKPGALSRYILVRVGFRARRRIRTRATSL